jgi:phosphate:Na+ symporter
MKALGITLQLLGALGVFLFGMKLMSEALQKVAGPRLKALLGLMTANRFTGVLTGFGVTAVVQSSSATTVMVVGFVTAGLLTLTQAIGVIMGANIGTTVTGWLVALLGFKIQVSAFALPAIGFGVAMTFMKGARVRQVGECLTGFGLLFLGLCLMKDAVPTVSGSSLAWITRLTGYGLGSIVLFVLIGGVLTLVLQSSSATMSLTLTFAAMGWLPFDMAAAMVVGENIGTTITAMLAAIGASADARRAARAHVIFNLVGALWVTLSMPLFFLAMVDWLVPGDPYVDFVALQGNESALAAGRGVITAHLAAFHTAFNILNTALLLPLVAVIERTVRRWVPDTPVQSHVRYISTALIETPELLIVQVGKEMDHMCELTRQMFRDSLHILTHPADKLGDLVESTLEREDIVDHLEAEIAKVLVLTARAATSTSATRKIAELLQNTHRIERIADHCAVLVRIARRLHQQSPGLTPEDVARLRELGEVVDAALENLGGYLSNEDADHYGKAVALEERIDQVRRDLRAAEIQQLKEGTKTIETGVGVLDALTHLEEIGDRVLGIVRTTEATRRL